MPAPTRVSAATYYDQSPDLDHRTGDIWLGLPDFGLLGGRPVSGIVITPACDLAHRKADAVTFLPIVSIRRYLGSRAFVSEVKRVTLDEVNYLVRQGHVAPPLEGLDAATLAASLSEFAKSIPPTGQAKRVHEARARVVAAAAMWIGAIADPLHEPNPANWRAVFGERIDDQIGKIIRNSAKPDLHFLPADGLDPQWSALPRHSVVLFRYPITVPVEFLDAAQDVANVDWPTARDALAAPAMLKAAFATAPLKTLRLRDRFIDNLVSRYIGLFVRIGAPDFSDETVNSYCAGI